MHDIINTLDNIELKLLAAYTVISCMPEVLSAKHTRIFDLKDTAIGTDDLHSLCQAGYEHSLANTTDFVQGDVHYNSIVEDCMTASAFAKVLVKPCVYTCCTAYVSSTDGVMLRNEDLTIEGREICKIWHQIQYFALAKFEMPSCRRTKTLQPCYVETFEVNEALRTQQLQYCRNQLLPSSAICVCDSLQL